MLDPQLLEILVCPKCKGELEYRPEEQELRCSTCRLRYEIRDGIPIMLVDEAKPF
ncbi:MAG: Trm112 family protein [Longimicrobiales bacterium]